MKKLKDLLKESYVWERKFGEKLPTLKSVQEKKDKEKLTEAKYGSLEFSPKDHFVVDRSFKKMNGVKLGAWEADVKGWNNEENYKQFVGEFNANAFKLYDLYKKTVVKFKQEADKMSNKKHKLLKKWRRKDGQK